MHPIFYIVLSGMTLYLGAALLCVAVVLGTWGQRTVARTASLALVLIAAALMLVSGAPTPFVLGVLLAASVIAWIILVWFARHATARARWTAAIIIVLTAIAIMALELPYTLPPRRPDATFHHVTIVGDSVSAGFRSDKLPVWPDILRQRRGAEVTNLARAGATFETALSQQVPQVGDDPGLVILEIGGNDMLYGHPIDRFERELDELIVGVKRPGGAVVMLELPTMPLDGRYAAAQRRAARAHGVILVPRRYFARVLRTPSGTLDGVHLSDAGHRAMAEMIDGVIGESLVPPPSTQPDRGPSIVDR